MITKAVVQKTMHDCFLLCESVLGSSESVLGASESVRERSNVLEAFGSVLGAS